MTARRLGVGIIGAGAVGQMRARVVARNPRARLVAVADVHRASAEKAARCGAAKALEDYRRMLDDDAIGAVIVSSPAPLHRDMVMDALAAGKHVLCEKPLATTIEACREIVAHASDAGLTVAVGFNHRYFPCVKALKHAVDSGSLGQIEYVRALAGHRGISEFRADWMYQGALSGGGAMMDIGLHLTDLIRHLVGEITEVYGTARNNIWHVPKSEDHAAAMFTTAAGIPVSYHATWGEWKGYRLVLDVYGVRGTARAFYAPMASFQAMRTGDDGRADCSWRIYPWVNLREKLFGWETTATLAFSEEFEDFLRAISGEWRTIADAVAGLRAVEIAAAVHESGRSRMAVSVPLPA